MPAEAAAMAGASNCAQGSRPKRSWARAHSRASVGVTAARTPCRGRPVLASSSTGVAAGARPVPLSTCTWCDTAS